MNVQDSTDCCPRFEPEPWDERVITWIEEMKSFVKGKGKVLQRLYFFYTTCPKCSKKDGKNYVVILAQL